MLRTLWRKWLLVAGKIGYFQSQLVLALVYFVVMAPFALAVRLFSDPLCLRSQPSWRSLPRDGRPASALDSVREQF